MAPIWRDATPPTPATPTPSDTAVLFRAARGGRVVGLTVAPAAAFAGSERYSNGGWDALLDRWDQSDSSDKTSFERHDRLTIEHGPQGNVVPADYTSVAFYYGDTPPAVVTASDAPDGGEYSVWQREREVTSSGSNALVRAIARSYRCCTK